MNIETWNLDDSKKLTDFYNQQIANLPYRFPVTQEEFDWGIRHSKKEDIRHTNLHSEQFFVGEESNEIKGFIHVAIEEAEEDGQKIQNGLIRFFSYQPGYRQLGQALLEQAEDYLRQHQVKAIKAFSPAFNYRFFFIGYGVPDSWGHVTGLLRINGYEIFYGEIFMAYPNFQLPEPKAPGKYDDMTWEDLETRSTISGLSLRVFLEGRHIGICNTLAMSHFYLAEEVQNTCFVAWLNIEEEHQGKRWGEFLLHTNLQKLKERGFQHTLISTNINNHRALLFYTNMGYQIVDTSYAFLKNLT